MTKWIKRHKWCLVALIVLAVGIGWFGYRIYKFGESIEDAYMMWWASNMVTGYMGKHQDQWPRGWEDLREPFEVCCKEVGARPWPFDKIKDRIEIDWNADPAVLRKAEMPPDPQKPFIVIWSKRGNTATWSGAEPNRLVLEYLQSKRDKK